MPRSPRRLRRPVLLASVAATAALSLTACGAGQTSAGGGGGGAGGGDAQTIKVAWYASDQNIHYTGGALLFQECVAEESDGQLTAELYPSEQLGKVGDSLTMLDSGIADMAFTAPPYHPELRYSPAWDLPLGLKPDQNVEARWLAAHQEGPLVDEYKAVGVVPVIVTTVADYELSSTDRPLPDLASAQGLQPRVGTDIQAEQLRLLGMNPVKMPSSEQFEALDRGVVNGNLFHYPSFGSTGIETLLNYGTTNLDMPSTSLNAYMSQSFWDGLSEEQQQAVYECGRQGSIGATDATLEEAKTELARLVDEGFETFEWPEADVAKMNELFASIPDQWIGDIGEGAQEAVDQVEEVAPETTGDGKTELEADFDGFQF